MPLTLPKLDYKNIVSEIEDFIREVLEKSGAEGLVVGLSGGVDSSLTVTLCVRAVGSSKVLGLIMPSSFTPLQDVMDAEYMAKWLGIHTEKISITGISDSIFRELKCNREDPVYRVPMANVRARIRMLILYYYANLKKYLVVGTGDKSERLIGYFTKYGDGGVDLLPIGHLYKTHVRELSKYLNVPDRIAYKPSSPQLYPGHKATDEIPLDYDRLDPILYALFDLGLSVEETSVKTETPIEIVREVVRRFETSRHKRSLPLMIEK